MASIGANEFKCKFCGKRVQMGRTRCVGCAERCIAQMTNALVGCALQLDSMKRGDLNVEKAREVLRKWDPKWSQKAVNIEQEERDQLAHLVSQMHAGEINTQYQHDRLDELQMKYGTESEQADARKRYGLKRNLA